ncbi:MBL fold metallo-hydrolase [Candidatus Uhrbacteria bacterium]|nr:MBL fold metallo-hydrolase [Candidatus Uhrbacteria bacterium]
MQIVWHGLSCFEVTSKTPDGDVTLVLDPYAPETGLKLPRSLSADLVAATHGGEDAHHVEAVEGEPFLIDMPGEFEAKGVFVFGIHAPLQKGSRDHRIFCVEQEGLRLVHLGALDRPLTDEELQQLGQVDILMVPVGGGRVLSPKAASEVISQVEPRVVIPMSHQLPGLKEEAAGVESFCKELGVCRREEGTKYKVTRRDLPEEDMLVMTLQRG